MSLYSITWLEKDFPVLITLINFSIVSEFAREGKISCIFFDIKA